MQDWLTTLKSKEETHQCQAKLSLTLTSLMQFGTVEFGTIVPTSLMSAHFKGHLKNEENQKWIRDIKTGNGIIMHRVDNQLRHAHKDNIKPTKTT